MAVLRLFCLSLLLLFVPVVAFAQPPATMSYQGVLTDGSGNLVADGPYNLTFRLYTVSVGGVAIWTETQAGVAVARGGFNVTLGSVMALSALAFDTQYWLGVTVGGGSEMTPRTPLAASPYTLSPRTPIETEMDYTGTDFGVPGGPIYASLRTVASFTKVYSFTDIQLTWVGHAETVGIGSFCDFQIRVDGNATPANNGRVVLYSSSTSANDSQFSTTALFRGLAPGAHTVSIWLRGSASNCILNTGNFPQTVFIREMQQGVGVPSAPQAAPSAIRNGVPVEGK
jgi:hypothetical protein